MTKFQQYLKNGGENNEAYAGHVWQLIPPTVGVVVDLSIANVKARAWCEAIMLDWLIPTDGCEDLEPHALAAYEAEVA